MTPEENQIVQIAKVSDTVLSATQSLIKYLEGHTSKTEVVNQLESIATPDVKFVVEALQVLDQTLRDRPTTDLSQVTALMSELVNEAKQLPKVLLNASDIPQPIDYSKQLSSLKDAIVAVEKVVKAQKLVAEAPVVNVPETNVHVDAPDLEPLQNGFRDVVKAVGDIVIPEYKTDNAGVEKLLKDANKLLDKILTKPVSGGGGGGSSWPAIGTNGLPAPLSVDANGSLKTGDTAQAVRLDDSSTPTTTYIGKATIGTATSSTTWQIARLDTSSGLTKTWADGDSSYDNVWDNRTTLTYS